MPAVPATTFGTLSPAARVPMVFISTGLSDPGLADLLPESHNVRISLSAGGHDLDHCSVEFDLATLGERLVDLRQSQDWNRIVVVTLPDDVGNPTGYPLFWGELTKQGLELGRSEASTGTARLEEYHFGERPAWGMEVLDWSAFVVREWHHDRIEFNPIIDDILTFNRSNEFHPTDGEHYVWIDPESVRTGNAQQQGQGGQYGVEWDLRNAVMSLCWLLNPNETWVRNPVTASASSPPVPQPIFDSAARLVDTDLPVSQRLPKLLDSLLRPLGYGWYIRRDFDTTQPLKIVQRIAVFKRGEGPVKSLWYQRPDTLLNMTQQNAEEINTTVSIVDLANRVEAFGSVQEREVTLELYRCWTPDEDALTLEDLDVTEGRLYATHKNAWRRWTACLSGDWCGPNGPRDGAVVAPIPAAPLDLSDIFQDANGDPSCVPKRRRFGHCLTLGPDGERRAPLIEWWDGLEWRQLSSWGVHLIPDRDEIEFASQIPQELFEMGDEARLRITCSVLGDQRVTALSDRSVNSPNSRDLYLTLHLPKRFHDRRVESTGGLKSVLYDGHHYAVTGVTSGAAGTGSLTVAENLDGLIKTGDRIVVVESLESNGVYTVRAGSTIGTPTTINVEEAVPVAAVPSGKLCIQTAEQDDRLSISAYADKTRDVDDAAEITSTTHLYGIHVGYEIGDLIDKIDGRNIGLNRAAKGSGTTRLLQVTGREWDFQTQTTTLEFESAEVKHDGIA
jgi:hypothetical protein